MKDLKRYREKRDFSVTNEPAGSIEHSKDSLRFCVQRHAARAEHFDLRLESGGVALSWAIPKGPSFDTKDKRLAMRVEDHPVDYMDFEGIIPKGQYGGGTVMLWDEGTWSPRTDPDEGLRAGSLKFTLHGGRLKGDWALVRMKSEGGQGDPWLLIKERDGYEKRSAGISKFTRSVRSGRTMAEIERAGRTNPFGRAEVMLARLTESLPSDMGWVYELKYDGHRVVAFSENGKTRLLSRNGLDCTQTFSAAAEAVSEAVNGRAAVLDGEMVVVNERGISDFGALQTYAKRGGNGLVYVLFDLLALDGEDLRARTLTERKEKLRALLKDAPSILSYSVHTEKMTKRELQSLEKKGMEGIVIKRADSPYRAGKNGDWLKLKFRGGQEFVIGGFVRSQTGGLRSLLVGYYEEGELRYAGKVGTGFSEDSRRALLTELAPLIRKTSPFQSPPKAENADMVWLDPVLIAQIEYAEVTAGGLLRQPSFKGLRRDKQAKETVESPARPKASSKRATSARGETEVLGVAITHPEKRLFTRPVLTKLGLAEYYSAVAPRMLPHIKDRLLSLVCCPSGIGGEQFFRRHLDGEFAGVGKSDGDGEEAYFYVKNAKGIVALAQYNAVEFHVWGSKRVSRGRPDTLVFDLDPDEGLPLAEVRRGARELRTVLDGLGLVSFLKTSGGKGYHIVVPLRSGVDAESFRDFAKGVAELMQNSFPTRYTATMSKKAREGKIFIDWQRNSPGSTSVAPYSVRARAGAPVSTPISWEELPKIAPASVNVRSALRRLALPDPWENFFSVKASQRLKKKP